MTKDTSSQRKAGNERKPASKISPARTVAFQLLLELAHHRDSHSDELLQGARVEALSAQDRNLCTALVMGVLRWQLAFDAEIAKLLTHKSKVDEPVRLALRLALFQLLFLDRVPDHAAISDSVELTKRAGHRFASGLVNAVLRRAAAQASRMRAELESNGAHPSWMVDRWKVAYGDEAAGRICEYDQQAPPACVRIVDGNAVEALEDEGVELTAGKFLTSAMLATGTSVSRGESLRSGSVRLQDEGSQLVAEMLCDTARVESMLDCCAAPGGKTAILAERNPHARIVAMDVSEKRLASMQQRFSGSPTLARVDCTVGDVTSFSVEKKFERILCDVPCSGTGTLARNPEIKLRLDHEDILRQRKRQIEILEAALRCLAPGGVLVYSTCSLEAEENEDVIAQVIAANPAVRIKPVADRLHDMLAEGKLHAEGMAHLLESAVRGLFLRTIPGVSPCDGFFAAILTV